MLVPSVFDSIGFIDLGDSGVIGIDRGSMVDSHGIREAMMVHRRYKTRQRTIVGTIDGFFVITIPMTSFLVFAQFAKVADETYADSKGDPYQYQHPHRGDVY